MNGEKLVKKVKNYEEKWNELINKKNPKIKKEIEDIYINSSLKNLEELILKEKKKYSETKPSLATRQCSSKVIESITNILPQLIGGSADLSGSNNTKTTNSNVINSKNFRWKLFTLWSERTWYGGSDEWIGSLWRFNTLWGNISNFFRLLQTLD